MASVYVAAGSNIAPVENLSLALRALEAAFGTLTVSPAYRNRAVGFEGADFINLAVYFETDEPVGAVQQRLQEIEALCGRARGAPKWAPRTLDLDILLYGTLISDEPGLELPRPDLIRRPYMLKPMADIAPGLGHPTEHRTMHELWQALEASDHPMTAVTIPRFGRHRPPESGR